MRGSLTVHMSPSPEAVWDLNSTLSGWVHGTTNTDGIRQTPECVRAVAERA